MKLQGSQVVLPGGLRVHVAVLGAIATILAALILVRGRAGGGAQGPDVSTQPSATDQAIGSLQTDISSLQGAVQQLQTMPQAQPTTSAAPAAPHAFVEPASADPWAAANQYRGIAVWSKARPGDIVGWIPYETDLSSFAPVGSGPGGANQEVTLPGGVKGIVVGSSVLYH